MTTTRLTVTIKSDVHDPAGLAVKKALIREGMHDLVDVRIGKVIDLIFKDEKTARDSMALVARHGKSLFSNPIMEDVAIEIIDENDDDSAR